MSYQSGFISIIGSPNVGKSTLMNQMIGQKVSIVSQRAQTTRNRVMGVLTRPGRQMVFLDTPGVTTPKNRLGEYMCKVAFDALNEVEAILFVVDASRGIGPKDDALLGRLKEAKAPVVAAINKADLCTLDQIETARERLEAEGFIQGMVKLSALEGRGLDKLEAMLTGYLTEGPQYFPEDMVTDQPERVICGEIIREKALELLREEVPHGLGVGMDKIEARPDGVQDIWATIYCERAGHKGIIIGKKGSMLKKISTQAREDMEAFMGAKVYLETWVKVKENWRDNINLIHNFGYTEE